MFRLTHDTIHFTFLSVSINDMLLLFCREDVTMREREGERKVQTSKNWTQTFVRVRVCVWVYILLCCGVRVQHGQAGVRFIHNDSTD